MTILVLVPIALFVLWYATLEAIVTGPAPSPEAGSRRGRDAIYILAAAYLVLLVGTVAYRVGLSYSSETPQRIGICYLSGAVVLTAWALGCAMIAARRRGIRTG